MRTGRKSLTAWLLSAVAALFCMVLLPGEAYAAVVTVGESDQDKVQVIQRAFNDGNDVKLDSDITIPDGTVLTLNHKNTLTLDTNGHTVTIGDGGKWVIHTGLTLKTPATLGQGRVQVKAGGQLSIMPGKLTMDRVAVSKESGGKILYSVATSSNAQAVETEQEAVITWTGFPGAQSLLKGSTLDVGKLFKPAPASNLVDVDVTRQWATSDASVAEVTAEGKVTGKKAGTAVITVWFTKFPTLRASVNVTVTDKDITGITLSETQFSLIKGERKQLTAKVTAGPNAGDADKKVTWSSGNTAVATVDANGQVTGVSQGTAEITAAAGTGADRKTAVAKVIVYEAVVGTVEMTPVLVISSDVTAGRVTVKMPYDIYSDFPSQTRINVNILLPAADISNIINQTSVKEVKVVIEISKEVDERANVNVVNIKAAEEIFKKLKEKNKNILFEIRKESGGTLLASWAFNGSQITKAADVNLHTELIKTSDVPAIKRLVRSNSNTAVLRISHDSSFPGRAKIITSLDSSVFAKNNSLYLYYYNESRNRLEYMGGLTKVDSSLTTSMTLSKGGDYLISRTRLSSSSDHDDDDDDEVETGRWIQTVYGWWYRNANGSYPANKWQQINGKWYLFNQSGYMMTGWQLRNGVWYFLQPDGSMVENNWVKSNGRWYFLSDGGAMTTGWQQWKNKWYYLSSPNGEMAEKSWLHINNRWFYVGEDGVMFANQWLYHNNKWYFFESDGSMALGWVKWKNNWYYMNFPNGDMAVNTTVAGGYRVNADGVMY